MTVAKVIEITAESPESFEDGEIVAFRVNMKVTFVLAD